MALLPESKRARALKLIHELALNFKGQAASIRSREKYVADLKALLALVDPPKKWWQFWLVLALASAPLQAQGTPYAITSCSTSPEGTDTVNYPVTHYRSDIPMTLQQQEELAIHEAVHRAQLQPRDGRTCQQILDSLTSTPMLTLEAEAPAYCAQVRFAAAKLGLDLVVLRNRAAQLYASQMPGVTLMVVAKAFRAACPAWDEPK